MVVAIFATVAGLVLLRGGSVQESARVDATRATLARVREGILGSPGLPGFRSDLGELPIAVADLLAIPALLPSGKLVKPWDPYARAGWNGPYLVRRTGSAANPTILDGWLQPVVLQRPDAAFGPAAQEEYARLVSLGGNGVLDTSPLALAPDIHSWSDVGDDVVLYLVRANGP